MANPPFDPTIGQTLDGQAAPGAGPTSAGADAPASDQPLAGLDPRYEPLGEIARGGMGVIWRVRDRQLNRDLAIKVIAQEQVLRPEFVRRFHDEAQISGQLQHPGVVPVHELGTLPDGRPYFTMKLVKGRTLAELLIERRAGPDANADLPRYLKIFEQVCQTIAYAHAKSVIHRDLKPANIMVGAFGEVQVMDWGLGKVLSDTPEPAKPRPAPVPTQPAVSIVEVGRTPDSATHAGSILGTFAYMPPEQARGETEALDRRCDVFGLGAFLAEILTGAPPYTGHLLEVRAAAQLGHLDRCLARLDACGADAALVALARRSLAVDPADRPKDAGEVAGAMTAYLNAVQEKLRQAELAAAEARVEATERRKRRRVLAVLALTVVVALALGFAGLLWSRQEREARLAKINADVRIELQEAMRLREEASKLGPNDENTLVWTQSRERAQRAAALLESGPVDPALRAEVEALLESIAAEEREYDLLVALEKARSLSMEFDVQADAYSHAPAIAGYREALRRYGVVVGDGEAGAAAERLRKLPPTTLNVVVPALDHWIALAADPEKKLNEPHLDWLRALVGGVDQDPWRQQVRAAAAEMDPSTRRAALAKLAAEADVGQQSVLALLNLVKQLDRRTGNAPVLLLQRVHRQHPGDFWVNLELGQAMLPAYIGGNVVRPGAAEAVRYFSAAVALRPSNAVTHCNLAYALLGQKKYDEAIGCCRKALTLEPDYYRPYLTLGIAYSQTGQHEEAIAAYQEVLKRKPNLATVQNNLGVAYGGLKQDAEAIASYKKAIELDARIHIARRNLGSTLLRLRRYAEALPYLKEAVPLSPEAHVDYVMLGDVHFGLKELPAATEAYRKAIEIKPDYASAHFALGEVLRDQNQLEEAIAELELAIKHDPDLRGGYGVLAQLLDRRGDKERAELVRKRGDAAQGKTASASAVTAPVVDFRELHDADSLTLERWLDELPPGFRPTYISRLAGSEPPRFNVLAVRDGRRTRWLLDIDCPDWPVRHGAGWQLAAYCINEDPRKQAAIWVREGGYGYQSGNLDHVRNAVNDLKNQGQRPVYLYRQKHPDSDSGVLTAPANGDSHEVHFDLTREQLSERIAQARKQGWRPEHLTVFKNGPSTSFSVILVSNPAQTTWELLQNLSVEAFEQALIEQTNLGRRPVSVVSDGEGDQLRYTAIWLDYRPDLAVAAGDPEESPWHQYDKGLRLFEQDKQDLASASLMKAIALKPDFIEARQKLAACWLALGKKSEALAIQKQLYQLQRSDPQPITDFLAVHDADAQTLQAWNDALPAGYRIEYFSAQPSGDSTRFQAIAIRDGRTVPTAIDGLGGRPPPYEERFRAGLSFRGYAHGLPRGLEVLLWSRMPARKTSAQGEGYFELAVAQAGLAKLKGTGDRPGYPIRFKSAEGQLRYGAMIWPDEGLEWECHFDLALAQLLELLDKARERGWRPDVINTPTDTRSSFNVVLVANPTERAWSVATNLNGAELEQATKEQRQRGLRPLSIVAYGSEPNPRYAAAWIDFNPDADAPAKLTQDQLQNPRQHFFCGVQAFAAQRWHDAEAAFRAALLLKPDYADAHKKLSEVLRQQGKHAEARVVARQAYLASQGQALPETLQAVDYREIHGVYATTLDQWLKELPPGFRPIFVSAQANCDPPCFHAIAVQDGVQAPYRFDVEVGLRQDTTAVHEQRATSGLRHRFTAVYYETAELAYRKHDIWVRDGKPWTPSGHGDRQWPEVSAGPVRAKQLRPVCPYYYRGKDGINGWGWLAGPDEGLDWEVHYDLTADQLHAKLTEAQERGWRPDALINVGDGKQVLHAVVLVANPTDAGWDWKQNLMRAELAVQLQAEQQKGRRPLAIVGSGPLDQARYSAIWIDQRKLDRPFSALPKPGEIRTLFTNTEVWNVAFSPDGKRLAIGGFANPIVLVEDLVSGREVSQFAGLGVSCLAIGWSPDGTRVVSGHGPVDASAIVWDVEKETLLAKMPHSGSVIHAEFSPDGTRIATATNQVAAHVFSVQDGQLLHTLAGHTGTVFRSSFRPDGSLLLTTCNDDVLRLWDTRTGAKVREFRAGRGWQVGRFSRDGKQIVTGCQDGFVRFFDLQGKLLREWPTPTAVWHLDVSPDGRRVLTTHQQDNTVRWWDAQTGKQLWQYQEKELGTLRRAMLSPDGKLAAAGVKDHVRIFGLPE